MVDDDASTCIIPIFLKDLRAIRNVDPILLSAMPVGSKQRESKASIIAFLEGVAGERACACCYYTFLQPWLSERDQASLIMVSKDCRCDFLSLTSSENYTDDSEMERTEFEKNHLEKNAD